MSYIGTVRRGRGALPKLLNEKEYMKSVRKYTGCPEKRQNVSTLRQSVFLGHPVCIEKVMQHK